MNSIKEIIQDLGYDINRGTSTHYSCLPRYRNSNNHTALAINKSTGEFYDFVTHQKGGLEKLIRLTLNFETDQEAEEWILNKQYHINIHDVKPRLIMPKQFNKEDFFSLPHKYFEDKGVSRETMKLFGHGVCHSGSQRNRYTFLIPDETGVIIGVCGRLITKEIPDPKTGKIGKWKIQGSKKNFIYPYYLNRLNIQESEEVILVESIGDFLALHSSGLKHGLVLFGTALSSVMLGKLIEVNPSRIIIATNNDLDGSGAGNRGADEIASKLKRLFDSDKIIIGLPTNYNDLMKLFEAEGTTGIRGWYNGLTID